MPLTCDCPSCGRRLLVPDDVTDREVSCPTCHAVFVPADRLPRPETGPAARPAAEAPRERAREELPSADSYQEEGAPGGQGADITVYPAAADRADYRPLREPGPLPGGPQATVAMILLAVSAVLHLVSIAPQAALYQMLGDGLHGAPVPAPEEEAVDATIGMLALLELGLLVGTAIAFCAWFYQAHKNLGPLGAAGLTYTPGWAAGAFFVPILNLYRPYQIAQETWKASDPATPPGDRYGWRHAPGSSLIGAWWACWLLGNFVGAFATRLEVRMAPQNLDGLRLAALGEILSDALAAAAAVLALVMIKQIRRRQLQKYDALPAG